MDSLPPGNSASSPLRTLTTKHTHVPTCRTHALLPMFPPRELATCVNSLSRLLSPATLPLLGMPPPLLERMGPWHVTLHFVKDLERRAEALLPLCRVRSQQETQGV